MHFNSRYGANGCQVSDVVLWQRTYCLLFQILLYSSYLIYQSKAAFWLSMHKFVVILININMSCFICGSFKPLGTVLQGNSVHQKSHIWHTALYRFPSMNFAWVCLIYFHVILSHCGYQYTKSTESIKYMNIQGCHSMIQSIQVSKQWYNRKCEQKNKQILRLI